MNKFLAFTALASGLLLTSCYSGKMIIDSSPDGEMKVDNYTTVNIEDPVGFISLGAIQSFSADEIGIHPGTMFQFGSFSKGVISGDFYYQFSNWQGLSNPYKADQSVPSFLFKTTYSLPLKVWEKAGKVKIPLNAGRYTIDYNSPFFRILSVEGGVGYSAINPESVLWAQQKEAETGAFFDGGSPKGSAIINQASVTGYLGIRLSHVINTHISGVSEGESYTGHKSELLDFRLGLKPLISSFAPDIRYQYWLIENSDPVNYVEYVPVSDFLEKSLLGFSANICWTSFRQAKNVVGTSSFFAEFGVEPGFSEKYMSTAYGRAGIMIGFVPKRK